MSKKAKVEISSRADADTAMKELYQIDTQMLTWASEEAQAVTSAREGCQLKQLHQGLLTMKARRAELVKSIKAWAEADRKEWSGKSLETPHGDMGFRLNPPSVALIKKIAKSFDEALALLKEKLKKFVAVETVERVDKEKILALKPDADQYAIAQLAECGLKIEQKEEFWVETLVAKKLEEEIKKAKDA